MADARGSDTDLISRIATAYQATAAKFAGHGDSMWAEINGKNKDIHEAAAANDVATLTDMLRNPHRTDLFYGFEFLAKSLPRPTTEEEVKGHWRALHKALVDLCEITGAIKAANPAQRNPPARDLDVHALLPQLDKVFGFEIQFPNPFPFEPGLPTKRGTIGSRSLAALYQTWRIKELTRNAPSPRVLEIGAGLGRTAYYCYQAGIRDYTIIDLPMTNVAQANFLGRVLPADAVSLAGEIGTASVNIRDVTWRPSPLQRFDLIMNIDSLTEMDREHAEDYLQLVRNHTNTFLSINHEANPFTVRELLGDYGKTVIRNRYAMRAGYIEEIVFA